MATGPAAGTTRGDEPPRLPGISQLQQAVAVAALLLMLPLLKGAAPKKGEPLPVSMPAPAPPHPPPPPAPPPPAALLLPHAHAVFPRNPQFLNVLLTVMLLSCLCCYVWAVQSPCCPFTSSQ